MFGLRRHRARVQVAPPTPLEAPAPSVSLSEEQLFEVVRERLDEFVGANGDWTLIRRSDADSDEFFQSMTAFSVARDVTTSILATARGDRAETAKANPTSEVTLSGFAGFGASVLDFQPVEASEFNKSEFNRSEFNKSEFNKPEFDALVTRPISEQITFELDAIAVWADPKRHDPAHVSPDLVSPPAAADDSRLTANAS